MPSYPSWWPAPWISDLSSQHPQSRKPVPCNKSLNIYLLLVVFLSSNPDGYGALLGSVPVHFVCQLDWLWYAQIVDRTFYCGCFREAFLGWDSHLIGRLSCPLECEWSSSNQLKAWMNGWMPPAPPRENSSCLTAFELGHSLFLAFGLKGFWVLSLLIFWWEQHH